MKKVLIVDDSNSLLKTLQGGFVKYQKYFEAIYAGDGLEAMNLLDKESISLVVSDIQMPGMDGLVLLAFIRERYPNIPCIIMSAYGDDELKAEIGPEIIHFIDKPVHVKNLAEIIISALSQKQGGKAGHIAICDLLNLIILGRKSCIFKCIPDKGDPGYFYFYQGNLYNAVCGDRRGVEAVMAILKYNKAQLVFTKPPKRKVINEVNADMLQIIQQAKASNLSVSIIKKGGYPLNAS